MNTHDKLLAPAPLQATCPPMADRARPEPFHPAAPSLLQALQTFGLAAAGVLALPAARPRAAKGGQLDPQQLQDKALQIAPHSPLLLAKSSRQTVRCDRGTVWITQGDGRDHVLIAGQRLKLAPRDQVIVKAMRGPAWVRCLASDSAE